MHAVVKGPSAPATGGRQNSSPKITSIFVLLNFKCAACYADLVRGDDTILA